MNDLHHPCERWAEPISLAAAGCLPSDEESEVSRHIEACSDCRERLRQLTQLCGALAQAQLPDNVAEMAIVERIMSKVASDESQRPLVPTRTQVIHPALLSWSRDTWRRIAGSRVSRVAAAVIFVFAIAGVALWFYGSGATFAFADFIQPILEAKTVKYKLTVEMEGPPAVTVTSDEMVLDATRSREEVEIPDGSKTVQITDWGQGKSLNLYPAAKQATVLKFSNTQNVRNNPSSWFRSLQIARDNNDKMVQRESLGEKEINGRRVVGFRLSGDGGPAIELWGDPKTGMPLRVEMTMGIDGKIKATLSDFVFNADMDKSLFSVEPPIGYTVRNENADVSPNQEKDLIEMFREYTNLTGAFPDSLDLMRTTEIFWMKANIQMQWQYLVPNIERANEEQRHKFEELMFEMIDGKTNEEQKHKIVKEVQRLTFGMLWDNFAPENLKTDAEQKHRFEELMLKSTEGKPNDEQGRKIEEEIRKIGGDQMLKAMETWHAPTRKTTEVQEAQTQKFMEAQQRVQRGLQFANQFPPAADAHYVGKGVSLNAADTPIFWYRWKNTKNYRVIYADLSVRDADTPPNAESMLAPSSSKK